MVLAAALVAFAAVALAASPLGAPAPGSKAQAGGYAIDLSILWWVGVGVVLAGSSIYSANRAVALRREYVVKKERARLAEALALAPDERALAEHAPLDADSLSRAHAALEVNRILAQIRATRRMVQRADASLRNVANRELIDLERRYTTLRDRAGPEPAPAPSTQPAVQVPAIRGPLVAQGNFGLPEPGDVADEALRTDRILGQMQSARLRMRTGDAQSRQAAKDEVERLREELEHLVEQSPAR